jgi:uncharacterized protein related to proFAR isomerase
MPDSVNQEDEGQRVRVCPYCYSPDITEKLLIGGPMAYIDNDDGGFRCLHCGKSAVPMDFGSWDEYQSFIENQEKEKGEREGFRNYPIMPLLWEEPGLSSSSDPDDPAVVDLRWDGALQIGERIATLTDYWRTATKEVYGSKQACFLDLNGIIRSRPEVDGLQRLLRRRNDILMDIGVRREQDVYDSFTMGATEVLACTWTIPSIDIFRQVLEMTEHCIPCICYDGKVRWGRRSSGQDGLREVLDQLTSFGYREVAVLDLRRLGTDKGPDMELVQLAKYSKLELIMGGGITKEHVPQLQGMGVVGALLEPFAPEMVHALSAKRD